MKIRNRLKLILIAAVLSAIVTMPTALACTTRTPGYWKNHTNNWVIPDGASVPTTDDPMDMWIGQAITKQQAIAILNTPVGGDARINLQQKLIAAVLSIGADPGQWDNPDLFKGTPTMTQLYNDACAFLAGHTAPLTPRTEGRAEALTLAGQIDYWLNYYDAD